MNTWTEKQPFNTGHLGNTFLWQLVLVWWLVARRMKTEFRPSRSWPQHRQWQEFNDTNLLEVQWIDVTNDTAHKCSLKEWLRSAAWCNLIGNFENMLALQSPVCIYMFLSSLQVFLMRFDYLKVRVLIALDGGRFAGEDFLLQMHRQLRRHALAEQLHRALLTARWNRRQSSWRAEGWTSTRNVPIVFDDLTPGHIILANLSIHNKSWKLKIQ